MPTEKKDPETGKPLPPFLPLYPPVEPFHFASINSKVEQQQRQNAVNKLTANYHEFEERIGYKFNNIAYLLQALTHASYQYNQVSYKDHKSLLKYEIVLCALKLILGHKLLPKIGIFG